MIKLQQQKNQVSSALSRLHDRKNIGKVLLEPYLDDDIKVFYPKNRNFFFLYILSKIIIKDGQRSQFR